MSCSRWNIVSASSCLQNYLQTRRTAPTDSLHCHSPTQHLLAYVLIALTPAVELLGICSRSCTVYKIVGVCVPVHCRRSWRNAKLVFQTTLATASSYMCALMFVCFLRS